MVTESTITVEERLARIEKSIEKLASGMNQAPVMMSMATDTIDEIIGTAKRNGTDVDGRLKDGLHLLGRLSDPNINGAINNLLDLAEQAPGLISMAADSVDNEISKANQGSVRIDDRIQGVTHLLAQLSDPKTIEKVDLLLNLTDQAPGLIAMAVDSVDAFALRYHKEFSESISFLQQGDMSFLKNMGDAFNEAQKQEPAKVGGIFGMLKAIKDPERQKALGFMMNVLKNIGKTL